jgi:hypothetical protein
VKGAAERPRRIQRMQEAGSGVVAASAERGVAREVGGGCVEVELDREGERVAAIDG